MVNGRNHCRIQEMMKEMDALTIGGPVFFDLRDPWFHAPS
jgi:hypothetical protein